MRRLAIRMIAMVMALTAIASTQSLTYSGTPTLLGNVTLTMHGAANQPYLLAASDNAGPTVVAPLGSFDLGYPPILIAGAIPGLPVVPSLDAQGNVSMTFNVPNQPSLIGTTWWFQGVYVDPLSPFGLSKSNGVHFTILNPALVPSISGISPQSGPALGGTQLSILGTNFVPGSTTVKIGANALQPPVSVTANLITGIAPPGTPGTSVDVAVTTAIGGSTILASGFSYHPSNAPNLVSISPSHAPISGGSVFNLTGQGLGPGTTIYINGVACVPIAQTPTTYSGIVPSAVMAGFAPVLAVSVNGSSVLANLFRYTINLDVGNGVDGVFAPTSNVTLDTSLNGGVFNYTAFIIPAGVTVTARGQNPLVIKCLGDVLIQGTLDLKGEDAPLIPLNFTGPTESNVLGQMLAASIPWPKPGAGGSPGGCVTSTTPIPVFNGWKLLAGGGAGAVQYSALFTLQYSGIPGLVVDPFRPQASHGTAPVSIPTYITTQPVPYGAPDLSTLTGGSGGFGHLALNQPLPGNWSASAVWTGAPGGGAVELRAGGTLNIQGSIDARGGSPLGATAGCGSGGAVRLMATSPITISNNQIRLTGGIASAAQLPFTAGNGRWAIVSWVGAVYYGTEPSVPLGTY